ncbi:dTMP kinase [soil metagenome]
MNVSPLLYQKTMPGKFITFEGGEGAGKSTQVRLLAERLIDAGHAVTLTREPGGTPTAESIRRLLLSGMAESLGVEGEAVLFAAARADHVERVIRPALASGHWVISDRFFDSTRVYQAAADESLLAGLERIAVGRTRPDLTFILDLPAEEGLARAERRMAASGTEPDRFERDELALHEARRQRFLEIARREPERCVVIDATPTIGAIADSIWRTVTTRLIEKVAERSNA